jgi:hypothetical protein
VEDATEVGKQTCPGESIRTHAQLVQQRVGGAAFGRLVVLADAGVKMLELVAGTTGDNQLVECGFHLTRGELFPIAFPHAVEILGDHLKKDRHGPPEFGGDFCRNLLGKLHASGREHVANELFHLGRCQDRERHIVKIVDFIQATHGVERAGEVHRAANEPSHEVMLGIRLESVPTEPSEEGSDQFGVLIPHVDDHIGELVHQHQEPALLLAHHGKEFVAVGFPVAPPIRIPLAERDLEAADVQFIDSTQNLADELAARAKKASEELGMLFLEEIEHQHDEIRRMADVLDENRNGDEAILGASREVVEHAGLASAAGRGKNEMLGAQVIPQLGNEGVPEW